MVWQRCPWHIERGLLKPLHARTFNLASHLNVRESLSGILNPKQMCLQVLPLGEYVFNTEAHPLPLPSSVHSESLRSTFAHGPTSGLSLSGRINSTTLQAAIDFYKQQLHDVHGTA